MGVTIKSTNNIPKLRRVLAKLGHRAIRVGIFGEDRYEYGNDADLLTIAYVQEYGMTIRPKKAKWLTLPIIPAAKNKRASDFGDELFYYKQDGDDHAFLARSVGKDRVENVFLLVKSVTIPERSFIRTGFDANVDKIGDKIEDMLNDVLNFEINVEIFLEGIGKEFAGLIQKHAKRIKTPPKSPITLASAPNKTNPLEQSGQMIGAIREEIE